MRKIVSFALAVLLVAGLLCTSVFAAGAYVGGTTVENAKPGDTVTISFYISGNPGFNAAKMQATASYPLTVVEVIPGMMSGSINHAAGLINHASDSSKVVTGDGTLFSVKVAVAADAEPGNYPVNLSVSYFRNKIDGVDTNLSISAGSGMVKIPAPETPTEPAETEPVVTEPVETKPVETEPVETKPVETEPVETKPVETEPVETKPVETKPVETEPVETEPKPTETEPKPTETEPKPTETEPKPTETEPKPTETEPTQKPTQKPTEPKPTKPGKDEQPKNGDVTPYPVFFLLAVMAVAATAFVLKRKFDV